MRTPGFVFDERLYVGSATIVYAGHRETDSAEVVGKVVRGGIHDLEHELHLLRKLSGDGIPEPLGIFESSEGPVLVLRRFGQLDLAHAVRSGALSVTRAVSVGVQLAQTLSRIHAARILHRDINPANLLYDDASGQVALTDFGIAVELPPGQRSIPVRDLLGTPRYVPPEQTGRTTDGCDTRSDLYSLGLTLYHLLTGRHAFESDDLMELIGAQLTRMPASPRELDPAIPETLAAIVLKLCAKASRDRYQSAWGLAIDLRRCQSALEHVGHIEPFELAQSDIVLPSVAPRLYGREAELAILENVYRDASKKGNRLVLISGRDGSGRAALADAWIQEHPEAARARGGWRGPDEPPLSGVRVALSTLAHSLVHLDEATLLIARNRILDQLGGIGATLLTLEPTLVDVLGPQPELPELDIVASHARTQHAFRAFLRGLSQDHPVIVALTRFEFSRRATRRLIESALDDESSHAIFVLCARDGEVFGALRERPDAISLELGPIDVDAVATWLLEVLGPNPTLGELASILHEKSAGNPGALQTILEHFVETRVIKRVDGSYTWSLDEVRDAAAPPSTAALIAEHLADLPETEQRILCAIALAKRALDHEALAAAFGDASELARALGRLERGGMTRRGEAGYELTHPAIGETAVRLTNDDAARAMLTRLSQYWLHTRAVTDASQAFITASILCESKPILDSDELLLASELFLSAANEAVKRMAYNKAVAFFRAGEEALDGSPAAARADVRFEFTLGHARALMMRGEHDRAESAYRELCSRELTPTQIGIVYPSRCDGRSMTGDHQGALDVGMEGLARLGRRIPTRPAALRVLWMSMVNSHRLARCTIDDHINRADCVDERAMATSRILASMVTPAYFAKRSNIYAYVVELAVSTTLDYGHTDQTTGFLAVHGVLQIGVLSDYAGARRTRDATAALELARPNARNAARAEFAVYFNLSPWFGSMREATDRLEANIQRSAESGETLMAALSLGAAASTAMQAGEPLDRVGDRYRRYLAHSRGDAGVAIAAERTLNTLGRVSVGEPLRDEDLDAIRDLPDEWAAIRDQSIITFALTAIVLGHEAHVRKSFELIRRTYRKANFATTTTVIYTFIDGLMAARDAIRGERARIRVARRALRELGKVRRATENSHFEPLMTLLAAELHWAEGARELAAGWFARAVAQSKALEQRHLVAYGSERRAELATQMSLPDDAALYYREALHAYRRWALMTKVEQLRAAHPHLRSSALFDESRRTDGGTVQGATHRTHASIGRADIATDRVQNATRSTTLRQAFTQSAPGEARSVNDALDLQTVLRVSQKISTQLQADGVIQTVLAGIAQSAGAERIVFVQSSGGSERVLGEWTSGTYRNLDEPLDDYRDLPRALIHVLRRTAKPVIVSDASSDPAYRADEFVERAGALSIAGIPIVRKGAMMGFVMMENRLATGAFTADMIELAQALVAQAAISLDNAQLYEDMEARVRARTAELRERNTVMRLVLDNVAQGLAIVDLEGRVASESSAILTRWFEGRTPEIVRDFFAHDADAELEFEIAWEQLLAGILPLDLCTTQMPSRLHMGDRVFQLSWEAIEREPEVLDRILVVMSDITEALRAQESEAAQRAQMALFGRLTSDRQGTMEFIDEVYRLLDGILSATGSSDELRLIHTIKGNAGIYGLRALVNVCHRIETTLIDEHRGSNSDERESLFRVWAEILAPFGPMLDSASEHVPVAKSDYDSLLRVLRVEQPQLASELELWTLEPVARRLERIREQAYALANRLGKAPLRIELEYDGSRMESAVWSRFWSAFVHVVRNAIDHGLEDPETREALGKGAARLRLSAIHRGESFVVELGDDGAGIDWSKIADEARSRGRAATSRDDLLLALFGGGISTKDAASETSGRGVGMSAVHRATIALRGAISVDSSAGLGTTWRFEFPASLVRQSRARGARPIRVSESLAPPSA